MSNGAKRVALRQGQLHPEMTSFRLQLLAFIRGYIGEWQRSPSYGEMAAALDVSRDRIKKSVKSLARDGLLLRTPGPRGLALPEQREEALKLLAELGWQVNPVEMTVGQAASLYPLGDRPPLDYVSGHGQEQGGAEAQGDKSFRPDA